MVHWRLGKDTGGVTKEMWRLFGQNLLTSLCEGPDGNVVFRHDSSKVKVCNVTYVAVTGRKRVLFLDFTLI